MNEHPLSPVSRFRWWKSPFPIRILPFEEQWAWSIGTPDPPHQLFATGIAPNRASAIHEIELFFLVYGLPFPD